MPWQSYFVSHNWHLACGVFLQRLQSCIRDTQITQIAVWRREANHLISIIDCHIELIRMIAGSGRSLLLQGGNVPNSVPGLIYKCSQYDTNVKIISSLAARCPQSSKPVNLCLVGKLAGDCSTTQFPGADCAEQCTANWDVSSYWYEVLDCLTLLLVHEYLLRIVGGLIELTCPHWRHFFI